MAKRTLIGLGLVVAAVTVAWMAAIGPVAVWRVVTHGTTMVWDHEEYPGRAFDPSPTPVEWVVETAALPEVVTLDGVEVSLEETLSSSETLSLLVVRDGVIVTEWSRPGHPVDREIMVFSVTKSLLSLLVGAAIDDGILGPVDTPVTGYLPELAEHGFDRVTIHDLLRMDTGLDYIEGDNPFGEHVEFNYTPDLVSAILALGVHDQPDPTFRYKSGDYAVLSLVLARALGETSLTSFFRDRLWDPLGATGEGIWSTDSADGFERAWCCLAMTARDLARFGQLALDDGVWQGEGLISARWLDASFQPGYGTGRWPAEYQDSPLADYGYGCWLTRAGARLGLGKDGQYLYIDPDRRVVIVRQGESTGDFSWVELFEQVAASAG